ncbi:MAG: V4R domain-containing protein [Nitrososphaeria archaeon]
MGSASARGSDHIVSRLPLSWTEPGRRLASVVVEASGYSAVEEEHRAMESAGARILATLCAPSEGRVMCESIVDLGGLDPGELESRLRSIKGIGSAEVREGAVRGFASLPGRTLEAAGTRSILMTSRALRGMLLGMREFLGEEVGETALYYVGYYSGRGAAQEHDELLGPGAAPRVNFAVLQAHGYASSIEALRSPDGSRYRIEARDLVECDLLKGRMRGRTSHWFRGMLAGILEASEGGEWEVEEVECVNEGSDKCAFEARRRAPGPPAPRGTIDISGQRGTLPQIGR